MFKSGDTVRVKINNKVGVVVNMLDINDTKQYMVFHDANNIATYYENQLILNVQNENMRISKNDFFKLYSYHKLNNNSTSAMFSLNSGKIKFIPFQFRPLNKILNSDYSRILIADEVGVGKTIETGLIIKEFEKRDNVDSVIIICLKDLTLKWQREMKNKFDEHFEILDGNRLSYCLKEVEIDGYWPDSLSKCIVGLEMIRSEKNIQALESCDGNIFFDMLIVDEAHHVINSSSHSHKVVEFFSNNSRMAIFLSATPLQLGSYDLFSLLNLLVPEEYPDFSVFSDMAEPNTYINSAIRHMRNYEGKTSQLAAKSDLENIKTNNWARDRYHNNHQLSYWINRLNSELLLSDEERISFIKDLESLHTFSNVINRTKRKDIGEFTIREPITITNKYSNEEREFYEATTEFKRNILTLKYDSRTANFVMSTIERQITSCIPAFVMFLERFVNYGIMSLKDIADDSDYEEDLGNEIKKLKYEAQYLLDLSKNLPRVDNKAQQLLKIVDETIKTTNDKKLLVFSFFKNTLYYLRKQLESKNVRVEVITGDTSEEDREDYRNRFRKDYSAEDVIDVLLCSEVGCEGLDYEFCSRMVNYDIPWNPMKIEQRIGRIDRFGQKSPKVQIFNFITENTVEERIFFRCYERLGIFNSTVGDLEGVLGDMVSELSQVAINNTLNEKQQIIKANQLTDNAIRLVNEQRELESQHKELMLLDDYNNETEMKETKDHQILMLKNVVSTYLLENYDDTFIEDIDNGLKIRLYKKAKDKLYKKVIQLKQNHVIDRRSIEVIEFESYLLSEKQNIILSFVADEINNKNVCNVSFKHPLIILSLQNDDSINQCCDVILESDNTILPKGHYIFGCYNWKKKGYKESEDVVTVVYNIDTNARINLSVNEFEKVILNSKDLNKKVLINYHLIEESVHKMQIIEKEKLKSMNADIVNRRLATINQFYQNDINKTRNLMKKTSNKKILTMHQGHIAKIQAMWEIREQELKEKLDCDILVEKFAQGYLEVK